MDFKDLGQMLSLTTRIYRYSKPGCHFPQVFKLRFKKIRSYFEVVLKAETGLDLPLKFGGLLCLKLIVFHVPMVITKKVMNQYI